MSTGLFHPPTESIATLLQTQDWPKSTLYLVATPIGNLADLSFRALYTLQTVDRIACEDTKTSRILLQHWGIQKPLLAAHQHNEAQAAEHIAHYLAQGERIAFISDAGSPAVSDPGSRLVQSVRAQGYEVRVIPGPCAAIAALSLSGLYAPQSSGFYFAGFVPPKSVARQRFLQQYRYSDTPVVCFETPHRLLACLQDMLSLYGADRMVTLARELTKRFEQSICLPLGALLTWVQTDPNRQKGEFAIVIAPATQAEHDHSEQQRWLQALLPYVRAKDASKIIAHITGAKKDDIYAMALAMKNAEGNSTQ